MKCEWGQRIDVSSTDLHSARFHLSRLLWQAGLGPSISETSSRSLPGLCLARESDRVFVLHSKLCWDSTGASITYSATATGVPYFCCQNTPTFSPLSQREKKQKKEKERKLNTWHIWFPAEIKKMFLSVLAMLLWFLSVCQNTINKSVKNYICIKKDGFCKCPYEIPIVC